jgi:hypothetical protein
MKARAVVVLVAVVVPFLAVAEGAVPKPGPEHRKLSKFIGNWTGEASCVDSPLGPAEKWSAKIKAEAFGGDAAVVRHADQKGSLTGDVAQLEVLTYDGAAKGYTWYWVDSTGSYTSLAKMTLSDEGMKARWSAVAGGKTYRLRGAWKWQGTDKLVGVVEYSEDGKSWKPLCTGTETRAK